jgi:hypothetical protein
LSPLSLLKFTVATLVLLLELSSCSILATRPVQEMSDANAALKAAVEVQADTLAPELYRQAREWFFKAKQEYQLKNFYEAKGFAQKSRRFAERAEFEAIRNGAARSDIPADPIRGDEMQAPAPAEPKAPDPSKSAPYQPEDRSEFYDENSPAKPAVTTTPTPAGAPPIFK